MVITVHKIISHFSVLILAVGLSYFWATNESLSKYALQLIALIILVYLLIQGLSSKGILKIKSRKGILDIFLLTVTVYLIIFSTGGLSSPLFFLIYFLLFGLSLLFEPSSAFSLAIISTVFLIILNKSLIISFSDLLQLTSLYLIAPIALIFGSQYLKVLQSETKIKILALQERELQREVGEQETEVKKWTQGEFKNHLIKIWESIENLASHPSCKDEHKQKLQEVSKHLSNLMESGEKMEKKVAE